MTWLDAAARTSLTHWREQGLERRPAVFSGAQDPVAVVGGKHTLLFSSSNYLGLSTHPAVIAAASEALTGYGVGSGGSRLTTGTTSVHREVERSFARFLGYDDAVLFSSGFHANTAVLQTLAGPNVALFSDERNHASIIDGCRLAKAKGAAIHVYRHQDLESLDTLLAQDASERRLVITDGLFSMDGTLAPVPALLEVCRRHGAALMVDDAHAIGTVGRTGRGSVEHFELMGDRPDVLIGTASKALGAEGGVVATSSEVATLLRQQARPFVYSTSLAPATCAAIVAAIELLESAASPVPALHANVDRLSSALGMNGWVSPILPIRVGSGAAAMERSSRLADRRFFVPAIRWPTVPRDRAMLRVTVMATHTFKQIDSLAAELDSGCSDC